MKKTFLFLLIICAPLMGIEPSQELIHYQSIAQDDTELNAYLEQFPQSKYQIYEVPALGSFYLDDVPDGIKSHLKKGIYWESGIGFLIASYTLKGSVAVDLGAHIGVHTITMSRRVGPNGLVVAFEPQRKIYREHLKNLELNGCSQNVISLPFAVGEKEQMIEMSQPDLTNEGGTSVGSGGDRALMITLDSLNLNGISCIKMDVERYELKVIEGARQTIMRNMPVVIFEILGNYDLDTCTGEIREEYEETVRAFTEMGYIVHRFHGNDFIAFPPHRWLERMLFEEQKRWESHPYL